MAELVQKKGKKRNDDGLGTVVDFLLANARLVLGIGGAAMLGIATLAVKRIIDRAASPPDDEKETSKAEQKCIDESWKELSLLRASPKLFRKSNREALTAPMPSPPESKAAPEPQSEKLVQEEIKADPKRIPLSFTLQEKLLDYCHCHITVSDDDVSKCLQLTKAVLSEMQDFLCNKFPHLPFGAMKIVGPLVDGLEVLSVDHACFTVPLGLEPALWSLIPGEHTILNTPDFWLVKRVDLEYITRGSSPWDRFLVGGYLSSNVIIDFLHKILVGSINWPSIGTMLGGIIRPVVAPGELRLEVSHESIQLSIDVTPVIKMGHTVLLARSLENSPAENLWLQSFYVTEISQLRDLDQKDTGKRWCCLKILKGICKSHQRLKKLTGSHLAHVILHLSERESDWREEALGDRFQQVIEELIGYLENGFLPCYFNNKMNMFSELCAEDIDEMGYTFYSALSSLEVLIQKHT
ncbi:mitochondrial dynamics protein MID49 isoform X2 [Pleurodeles waltl]